MTGTTLTTLTMGSPSVMRLFTDFSYVDVASLGVEFLRMFFFIFFVVIAKERYFVAVEIIVSARLRLPPHVGYVHFYFYDTTKESNGERAPAAARNSTYNERYEPLPLFSWKSVSVCVYVAATLAASIVRRGKIGGRSPYVSYSVGMHYKARFIINVVSIPQVVRFRVYVEATRFSCTRERTGATVAVLQC